MIAVHEPAVAAAAAELAGWRFLVVDGIDADCEADLALLEQVLCAFDEAAGRRQSCHASAGSVLIFGICGPDASQQVAVLRKRLEDLNPPGFWSARRWAIRDGWR